MLKKGFIGKNNVQIQRFMVEGIVAEDD